MNDDGTFTLLIAEVALGNVFDMGDDTDPKLAMPPECRPGLLHDSVKGTESSIGKRVTGNLVHGEQYIVYHGDQAYPHFLAVIESPPSRVQFIICEAHNPHRFKVSREGAHSGWTECGAFWAFDAAVPGAAKFVVCDAHGPHRFKVSQEEAHSGWTYSSSFWAFVADSPGTTKFNICDAHAPHRFKVSTEEAHSGWELHGSFWAFV